MKNKTIYLLKMGMDTPEKLNHRIRLLSKNYIHENEKSKICMEFMLTTPYTKKETRSGKSKIIHGKENSALAFDIQYQDKNEQWWGIREFIKIIPCDLEYLEKPFERYIKYSYENILKIINFLLNSNYNNIILIEQRFIKNYNNNNFFNDEYIHDEKSYQQAIAFKKIAQEKIKQIKSGCRYDNSSYYYDGNIFKVLIHYNCYNEYLSFDLDNWDKAIKQINEYVIPEDKIRKAISQHNIKSSRLY